MSEPKYTITNESVSIVLNGQMYTIKRGDENFEAAEAAVRAKQWDKVPALVSRGMMLQDWAEEYAKGDFSFMDGLMRYRGDPIPHQLNERMIAMAKKGENPTFLMRFWEKLSENPSNRSVTQLYDFLKHNNIAIDQEGYILAYKGINRDYTDKYTGKISNAIGEEVTYPRNKISDDPRAACAEGLHAGALSYARDYAGGGRMVIVRIHPKDVVSVPYDCNSQKMRICAYKVIGHAGDDLGVTHNTHKDAATTRNIQTSVDTFADKLKGQPPKAPKAPKARPATSGDEGEPWLTFGTLSDAELADQKVWDLRKYASRVLGIVGASKLRKFQTDTKGNEVGLVARIIDVRKE
jgi:hypothetical protein